MITPAFELSQEQHFLTITIHVPYARASEFDLYIDGEDFKLYAKPYFLRLTLPGRIVEDGREKASFDVDKGLFTIRIPKETPGQHFEGLDMLTALLAPKGSRSAKPLVEEMGSVTEEEEEEEEEFDWQIDQTPYVVTTEEELNSLCRYGFGNQRAGVFTRLQDELGDVIDVKSPDNTTAAERRQKRLAAEQAKFDPDHYLADLFEDDYIQHILKYQPWWIEAKNEREKKLQTCLERHTEEATVTFSEEEKEQLRKFTNKSYLLDKKASHQVWTSLVDIILAYAYEVRTTEGETNVESAWNIRKLSGTLSWLESYNSIQNVLESCGRRVLCYPLYRHFKLIVAAIHDTSVILQLGKACVLKCLLDIHKIFRENDPAYILNDLYISDYCVWIQKAKSKKVVALAEVLLKTKLRKADLGFELEELEAAALLVQEEENRLTAVCQISRQRQSTSASENEETEDSSSCSSSRTDNSDSEEGDSPGRAEDIQIKQPSILEQKAGPPGATIIPVANPRAEQLDCAAELPANENAAISDSTVKKVQSASSSITRKLIEELGEQVHSVVKISEWSEGTASKSCNVLQDEQAKPSVETTEHTVPRPAGAQQGHFLEVGPKRNPLLIIANCHEDVEDS
ncbi:protein SHQ1 homolog isoform X2 [Polyodon spathula]|uniref:protein SHQ1 homolog isoform X2 n=1 Tax=Polyodon spathula TaxID=7913 RepID=UPI001B7F1846|nr:protein SHQ1 homolog isoform X2 [Polyodon spathula]